MQESSNRFNSEHDYLMGLTQLGPPFPVASPREATRPNRRNGYSYGSNGRSQRSYQPYPRIQPGFDQHEPNHHRYFQIGRNERSLVTYERYPEQKDINETSYYRGKGDNLVKQSNVPCPSAAEEEKEIQQQNEVNQRGMETASSDDDYMSCRCSSRTLKMLYSIIVFAFFTVFVIGLIVITRQSEIRNEIAENHIQVKIVLYLVVVICTIGIAKLCCSDKSN